MRTTRTTRTIKSPSRLRHPCVGQSKSIVETFEMIAVNQDPPFRPCAIKALLSAGLIEQIGVRMLGRDRFGAITVPVYAVPLPVHMQWCQWCAENVLDEDEDGVEPENGDG